MATPPNHQKLLIPGKNSQGAHLGYATDQRAIEMWANEGIVRKLIAGTGITLNPANGVDAGQGVEVSSSGGGGGAPGFMTITMAPDVNDTPLFLTGSDPSSIGDVYVQLFSNATASPQRYTFGASWVVAPSAGDSIDLLPEVFTPVFTGGGVSIEWVLNAIGFSLTNSGQVNSNTITLTSGLVIQPPTSDYGAPTLTADLTFVNGTGDSGNGFVTAGGETAYIASVNGAIQVNAGTTFP